MVTFFVNQVTHVQYLSALKQVSVLLSSASDGIFSLQVLP